MPQHMQNGFPGGPPGQVYFAAWPGTLQHADIESRSTRWVFMVLLKAINCCSWLKCVSRVQGFPRPPPGAPPPQGAY